MLKRKLKKHEAIAKEVSKFYEGSNIKFNDSFGKAFSEYGPISVAIGLESNLNKFKETIKDPKNNNQPQDILLMVANYAIMGILELDLISEASLEEVESEPVVEEPKKKKSKKKKEKKGKEEKVEVVETPADIQEISPIVAELSEYNKAELLKVGEALGLKVNKRLNKEGIISKLVEGDTEKEILAILDDLFGTVENLMGDDGVEAEQEA